MSQIKKVLIVVKSSQGGLSGSKQVLILVKSC